MKKSKKRNRPWDYCDAQATVPYVRRLLASLREHYIAGWHYILLNRDDPCRRELHQQSYHCREAQAALDEIFDLGVCVFDNPLRGIALFRFALRIELDEHSAVEWIAFWLLRDTRDEIETFVFASDLHETTDLLCIERPIPDTLKTQKYKPDQLEDGLPFLNREEFLLAKPVKPMPTRSSGT